MDHPCSSNFINKEDAPTPSSGTTAYMQKIWPIAVYVNYHSLTKNRYFYAIRTIHAHHNITITWLISLKSWLTNSIPPSKFKIASANASIVSMSKWLVGSSSNNMWGWWNASHANTTLHLWPSDKFLIGQIYKNHCIDLQNIQQHTKHHIAAVVCIQWK